MGVGFGMFGVKDLGFIFWQEVRILSDISRLMGFGVAPCLRGYSRDHRFDRTMSRSWLYATDSTNSLVAVNDIGTSCLARIPKSLMAVNPKTSKPQRKILIQYTLRPALANACSKRNLPSVESAQLHGGQGDLENNGDTCAHHMD